VADLIQRELSDLIRREVRDPRVGMVTSDLGRRFTGHVACQGVLYDARKGASQGNHQGLQRAASFLRSQLSKRMSMYKTPELRFAYDESVERGDRLSQLIDSVVLPKTLAGCAPQAGRRAAARQAGRPEFQRRAAGGQAPAECGKGGPRRHARSARLRPAAAAVRRGHQVRQFGLDAAKEYVADVRLGAATDTGTPRARIVDRRPVSVDDDEPRAGTGALPRRHRAGSANVLGAEARRPAALCAGARGQTVEREARAGDDPRDWNWCRASEESCCLRIRCSKGTYVRQLAIDLGLALGTVAHLAALRRTAVAGLRLDQAWRWTTCRRLGRKAARPGCCPRTR
jgi:ribosome-binding factor A